MDDICIVSSHFEEDLRWLENYFLPVVVVSKEGGKYDSLNYEAFYNVHRIQNKLREAGSYLWFIVNYWNHLPSKMFFIHGHESSKHQMMPIDEAINKYYNKLYQDFNHYFTYHMVIDENQDLFTSLWKNLYGSRLGAVPTEVTFELGSQFVVDRSVIRNHPLSFYRRIYDLSCDYASDPHTDYQIGVFFETTWPIIFNPDLVKFKSQIGIS